MGDSIGREKRSLFVPEPVPSAAAYLNPAVLTPRPQMGRLCWARVGGVWHAFTAENQAGADLQENRQPTSCPVATRAYETGEHGSVSRDRDRGRSQHLGAGR